MGLLQLCQKRGIVEVIGDSLLRHLYCCQRDVPSRGPFGATSEHPELIARNVASRHAALVLDTVIGFLLLPFNLMHLGPAAYGLWMLTASVTVHFSLLDLGFGSAFVRFVAQYRARGDSRGLNEIASTLFFLFAAVGLVAYAAAAVVAFNLESLFRITPDQAETGKWLLLVIGVHVAMAFPFSIYGGVVNGFQRYNVNSAVAMAASLMVAAVNVAALSGGLGLVTLVVATTSVRLGFFLLYRINAHRICPPLQIRPALIRRTRLREVMGFSVFTLLLDIGHRLNYQLDHMLIGAFFGAAPVAVWAPAARITTATAQLTNQLNTVLFPTVVDSDASARTEHLRKILVQGTRLSLAMVLPVGVALFALADQIIPVWVGTGLPEMRGSSPVLQLLAVVTVIRVGAGTATTVLKGANRHQLLAGASVACGFAKVTLSVLLIQVLGLTGVAVGTLVPLALSTVFIVFPAACRRVELPLSALASRALLPALWPAAVVAVLYGMVPAAPTPRLAVVAVEAAFGVAAYAALFTGLAVGRRDRALYFSMARALVSVPGKPAPPRLAPSEPA
jgi:O-antigen/teichoic acid export membrane protein